MKISNEDLIEAYREGDVDAFTHLVNRLGPGLLGYLRRMFSVETEADDLFQETFRKVLSKLEDFDTSRRFKPWLYRIAYNGAIDHIRKNNRGIAGKSISIDEDNSDVMTTVKSTTPTPLEAMDKRERKEQVRMAVDDLPARQKTTLILAYFHGMSYPQVADAMGCSVSTVKTHMSRALRKLATKLPSPSLNTYVTGEES